jgi:hypothetical protein
MKPQTVRRLAYWLIFVGSAVVTALILMDVINVIRE